MLAVGDVLLGHARLVAIGAAAVEWPCARRAGLVGSGRHVGRRSYAAGFAQLWAQARAGAEPAAGGAVAGGAAAGGGGPVAACTEPSLADLFAPPVEDVWLEIGFGGGEHLVWQARANPGVGLIGCEPFQDGVVKVLSAIGDSRRSMFCNPPLPTPRGEGGRRAREYQGACGRCAAAAALAALGLDRAGVRPVPRSLAQGATPQAPAGVARRRWASLRACCAPAPSCGSPPTTATMPGRCCWPLAGKPTFSGRPTARTTGAGAPPIGRQRAMRRRPCARGGDAIFSAFTGGSAYAEASCDKPVISRLQFAQILPTICALMIISTLRVGPRGPLFLFWAIG